MEGGSCRKGGLGRPMIPSDGWPGRAVSCGRMSGRRPGGEQRQQRHLVPQHGAAAVNRGRCNLSCDWARGIGVRARVTRRAHFNCDSAVSNCHSLSLSRFFFALKSASSWNQPRPGPSGSGAGGIEQERW